jgi:Lysozyme like domain/Peptidase M15
MAAAVLSAAEIARVAHGAGFRGDALERAVAVALAESGGDRMAHNTDPPDNSYGLWQINMYGSLGPARRAAYDLRSNRALFDPEANARAAWRISGRGRDFTPWSVYTSGSYRGHLDDARAAVAAEPWRRSDTPGRSERGDQPGRRGGAPGGGRADREPREAWDRNRPDRLRRWRRLESVRGGQGRKAMTFAWADALTGKLTEYLAEAEAVDRTTRHDARALEIDRLRLADPRHEAALTRALAGVLDDQYGLPRLCRSFARDVDFVVRSKATFRSMDVDGKRTVRTLTARLTDDHGRRYAPATVRGADAWLSAVMTPPPKRRVPGGHAPGRQRVVEGGNTRGRRGESVGLPDRARPTGSLGSYRGERFDTGVLPFVRALHDRVPGLRLTSGWRSAADNAAAGGVANSSHLSGRAADFVGTSRQMALGQAWARRHGAAEALIHDAGSGLHLHVAW